MMWWDTRKLGDGPTDTLLLEVPAGVGAMGGGDVGTGAQPLPSAVAAATAVPVVLGGSSLEYNVEAGT